MNQVSHLPYNKIKIKDYLAIPSVWLVYILLFGFILGAGTVDALGLKEGNIAVSESGKLIRAMSVLIAGILAFLYLLNINGFKYLLKGTNGWLFVFLLLCLASVIFSPLKTLTLFKSFEIFVILLILSLLYVSKDRYEASKKYILALFVFYTITICGSYLQFLIFGQEGQRQLYGETPLFGFMMVSKYPAMVGNALGYLGAVVALFGIYIASTINSNKKQRLAIGTIIFFLGTGVTFFSYTRSVMLFLYLSIFMYFAYRRKYVINVLLVLVVILPLALPQVQDKIVSHLKRGDSDEAISSMSGRTEMWAAVFDRRIVKIIIGDGYATGSKFMNYESTKSLLLQGNVHNGFLEVVMSVGLLGGIVWLGIVFRLVRQFYMFYKRARFKLEAKDRYFHLFMMSLLFLSIARSIMNSTFVYLDYFYPILMAFIMYGDSLSYKLASLNNKIDLNSVSKDKGQAVQNGSVILASKKTRTLNNFN